MRRHRSTILVVDDEPTVRELLALLFDDRDLRVALAPDVPSARAILGAIHVDGVILDHAMPGATGLELIDQLVADRKPVVVLSAHLTPEVEAAYRAAGIDRLVRKPFDTSRLRAIVRSMVGLTV